jgi:hypothetical protein
MYMNRTSCPIGITGFRPKGLGVFDSSDTSTWGWGEWLTIAAGAYVVLKLSIASTKASRKIYKWIGGDVF